ncbi:MAG TPA: hypothetical protein VGN78_12090 [Solirubrobacteraceae bacterium]|nr:hypothetical protein [Solirubrobacteraceae bacterium]
MGVFFIDTATGQIATQRQLREAGVASDADDPPRPWHRINAPSDASTMWYAVMRKRTRGVYIGRLCLRHAGQHASLLQAGWEEIEPTRIGLSRD